MMKHLDAGSWGDDCSFGSNGIWKHFTKDWNMFGYKIGKARYQYDQNGNGGNNDNY